MATTEREPASRVLLLAGLCLAILASPGAVSAEEVEAMNREEHDKRIDYIEIPTTDIAASKAFYGTVFGWTFQDWGDTYSSFADGRLDGGFRLEESVPESGGLLVVIYAVDLEAVEAAVRENGGGIAQAIFSFPGGRRFHFTDPSGNELAVWSDR